MQNIIITDSGKDSNIVYLMSTLGEVFSSTGSNFEFFASDGVYGLEISVAPDYADFVLSEVKEKIADIIAVSYKYDIFSKRIRPAGLNESQRQILLTALIAADLEEDRQYVKNKISPSENYSVEGIYNFKLPMLKNKWEEIVSYIPCFFSDDLYYNFVSYMIDDFKDKKVYVIDNKVFDSQYNRLRRSALLGEPSVVKEIILAKSRQVELMSGLSDDEENFLREYYGKHVSFDSNYFN